MNSLPPAYVVRREGNSFTLLVCSHLGGYPYPIMLCNITQNAMGQTPGGYPYPIMLCNISQNAMGQTPRGGTLPGPAGGGGYPARSSWGGYPARSSWGHTLPGEGGTLPGGTLPGGILLGGYPAGGWGVPCLAGSQLGQQKEYSLHDGRYASCVHAGGLSC